jgi:pyridoxal phosphate enzyme (YggS family)
MVAENIRNIRKRVEEACFRQGRNPADILVVGVTKTVEVERILQALKAGLTDVGENYVQELQKKRAALEGESVRWHFTGHLQRNKVKYIAEYIHLIHAVDNKRVAEELHARGEKINRSLDVLVEVNTTGEATKFGLSPSQTPEFVKTLARFPRVRVRGLMTMGPFSDDPNDSRPSFQQLRELRDAMVREGMPEASMEHLSMGMTHDFEVAIEEGATIVRIGTGIFGERG